MYFYNRYHNGDIHYSRNFVKDIISKTKFNKYNYLHQNNNRLLLDIPNLKISNWNNNILSEEINEMDIYKLNDIYINTWMGKKNREFVNEFGLDFKSEYESFKSIYNKLNIRLENVEYYIPSIDYSYYNIDQVNKFIDKHKDKIKVLISNGEFLSNQSGKIDFDKIINKLLKLYSNIVIILTNKSEIKSDRVFFTDDINNTKSDLNEISYLSTKCDLIIGRSSGPFTFCVVKDNRNKFFIDFCKDYQSVFCDYFTNYLWSNDYENSLSIIGKTINKIMENTFTFKNIIEKERIYSYWNHVQSGEPICATIDKYFKNNNINFCEIGCQLAGLSDLIIHEFENSKVWALDITNCSPLTIDKLQNDYPDRFKFLLESSLDAYKNFEDGFFDIIYIDTDPHKYEQLKKEINYWVTKVKNGGIVAFHDYGHSWHPDVKICIDEYCKENDISIQVLSYCNAYFIKK